MPYIQCDAETHRWEYMDCDNYEQKWKCLNCGELMTQYLDCGSGG